jgi:predicted component of type VI protein secretion system
MSDQGRVFLEACGASGPLRFEWADPATREIRSRQIEQGAFVIGRDPSADLVLEDASVEPAHAFLHVVNGRLFAIDLESSEGLRWGEIPRPAGWVNRGQTIRIGKFAIRFVGGDREEESAIEPAPTSSRYINRMNLPGVVLEIRSANHGKDNQPRRESLERVLTLAGSSDRCKLRVEGQSVARFLCALIRTPTGLWMTNISASRGATINGALCRFAQAEDEDVLQIGNFFIKVTYNDSPRTQVVLASGRGPSLAPPAQGLPRAIGASSVVSGDESASETMLQPLLEAFDGDPGMASSPFGQALVMMVRLLGDVHRDHLSLVREELAEIRRLSRDMDELRAELRQPKALLESGPRAFPSSPAIASVTPSTETSEADDDQQPSVERPRPSPEAVHEIISERIVAWERERQSRWRRIMRLMTRG